MGRAPYGQQAERIAESGKRVFVPSKSKTVQSVLKLIKAGMSKTKVHMSALVRQLNRDHPKSNRGRDWCSSSVRNVWKRNFGRK